VIPRSDIRALDVSAGSQAGKGAAIGLGLGLLAVAAAAIQIGMDDTRVFKEDAGAILAGLTGTSVLTGAVIGSRYPRWKRVPVNTVLRLDPGHRGVALSVSF
jgi:hypothetical protein